MGWENLPELLTRARSGDSDAWCEITALAEPFLLSQASKVMGSRWPQQSTSDLVQETWQRACQAIGEFRGGPTAEDTSAMFRAWLGKILRSQWQNCVRALLAQKRGAGTPITGDLDEAIADGERPSVQVRQHERVVEADAALRGLEHARDRDVLRLYFYDGLSFREIAAELEITLDKVRTSYHRGLERLKDLKRLQNLIDSLS